MTILGKNKIYISRWKYYFFKLTQNDRSSGLL